MDHQLQRRGLISASSSLGPLEPRRLLQLPDELLDDIMRHAYDGKDPPSSRPVCRRLRPHQERQLCRRVRLVSMSALQSFDEFLQRIPSCARIVMDLDVDLGEADLDWDWDATVVACNRLGSIVPELARLRELRIVGVGELVDAVLADGATSLRQLRRFELVLPWTMFYRRGVSGRDWFEKLGRQPVLEHIKLESDCRQAEAFFQWREPHFALPRLASLHLSSTDGTFSSWRLPSLFTVVPNLVELELSGLESRASVDEVLRAVPVGILKLVLCALVEEVDFIPALDLVTPRGLAHLARLERLELGRFEFDADLLPTLARLPRLRHLVFRLDANVTDRMLHDLGTTHRPPLLSRITLDHVASVRGPSFLDNGLQWDERARSTAGHALPGWVESVWKVEDDYASQSDAFQALERAGIVVEGTALAGGGWRRAHATESFLGTMLMCVHDGCMREMEKAWGRTETADALRGFNYSAWLQHYANTAYDDRTSSEFDADEERWY
ncbi:uncharacterized protein RHOBADRAFT_54586 [Rhodotorula graminis WP1]|uniref:F-box domain-containing protein n=1 Tax=Rhodotorula graminis (strain WP1) TaxID=578459 RepID=A0A0P9EK29_RHOGW|nr:uncharacterized protein RHOBADRAFT_54586 [Rhodotorula graminis WP1]KPV74012.1 hypothetical protein RHOBADRAFT_54586 [Rhodotorula graminis WP1]